MLLKLKQIDGGIALKNDVEILKQRMRVQEIREKIEKVSNTMVITHEPLENKPVIVELNGICYAENIFFTVNHATKTITWEHQRFDLDDSDVVFIQYSIQNNE